MKIPIRNLYYLFCYAWARFPENGPVDVGIDEAPSVQDLLAKILAQGVNQLLRRGLDRSYQTHIEETRSPRGRMMIDTIVKEQTLRRGAVVCAFDELTPDVLHNQIIKATARLMAQDYALSSKHRQELGLLAQRFSGVSDIRLTTADFGRAQLSRNSRQYRPLLRLCEFVFKSQLPDTLGGQSRFAGILYEEKIMPAVFEDFLRNFYGHEQQRFRAARETMHWDAVPLTEQSGGYLPAMETDITLRGSDRTIVIDAKYYKDMLVAGTGASKVRSSHLYQLLAYMEHASLKAPERPCDGALIYPAAGTATELRYRLRGHEVIVRSVDLTAPWQDIHKELLAIPESFGNAPRVNDLPRERQLESHALIPPTSIFKGEAMTVQHG